MRIQPRLALVADRSARLVEDIAGMLRSKGMWVAEAQTGTDALALARQVRPAVALVDLGLPPMDGYEVISQMRADPLLKETRVVCLTSSTAGPEVRRAYVLGARDHVTRYSEPDDVWWAVQRALEPPHGRATAP